MTSSWMPTWVEALWSAAFVAALAVHARHLVTMRGRARLWHGTHVLMALGMLDMTWQGGSMTSMPVGAGAGEVVFGAVALGVFGLVGIDVVRDEGPVWLWLIAAVDVATMAYMFAMTSTRIAALSVTLAAWFALESAGWLTGALSGVARRTGLGSPLRYVSRTVEMATVGAAVGAAGSASASAVATVSMPEVPENDAVHGIPVRVSLALMGAGMGYMLLAMQFGMGAMASMTHGGPGMPGM